MKGGDKVNGISMFLHHTINTSYPSSVSNEFAGDPVDGQGKLSFFQRLLSTGNELEAEWQLNQETESEERLLDELQLYITETLNMDSFNNVDHIHEIKEAIANLDEQSDDVLQELYAFLFGYVGLIDEQNRGKMPKELLDSIQDGGLNHGQFNLDGTYLLKLINDFQNHKQVHEVPPVSFFVNTNVEVDQPDQSAINKQLDKIMVQVELLLTNITEEQEIMKISPRILNLLDEWTTLMNKYNSPLNQRNIMSTESTSDDIKVQTIWKELLSTFQKRKELAETQHYQTNAKVTAKDISRWLHNILEKQFSVDESTQSQPINMSNQPVSKLEQYVIYLNQSGTSQSVDKQLIDQFQQVMKSSRFLTFRHGVNQLSISLRPENLGEMMVRFVERDGEMTLRIIVSSQSTKQILESNIHQLKNMFSPHQVVVEEREIVVDHANGQPEEQAFTGEEDQSQESNQEESQNGDKEYDIEFHDLLMNAKV